MEKNQKEADDFYSQNSMIFFRYYDFKPKIFLILYPSLENSSTGIAIIVTYTITVKITE